MKTIRLLPALESRLTGLGERLRNARVRRKISAEVLAARAGVTRPTLHKVERGAPSVAMGIYARVMFALQLDHDIDSLALDDELGRRLQDLGLPQRARAPKSGRSPS